ncbi:MAG: FixH family protein [Phycisphaerae bacterium]|nr:FixH family protein [Phycisphaerae bacterium]
MIPRPSFWPVAIVSLLLGNACIVAITVYAASGAGSPGGSGTGGGGGGGGGAIEPDYDRKALAWDQTARQAALDRALGWSATASITPAGHASASGSPGTLALDLRDGARQPIRAARITAIAFHETDPRRTFTLTLTPATTGEPGRFTAPLPTFKRGLWRVALTVDAVGTRFTPTLQVDTDLPLPRESGDAPCSQ